MATIRYGFIGAGAIGHVSARSVQGYERSTIVTAYDPHAGRLERLCAEHGIPHAAASAQAVFDNPAVDAVYIGVPNKFHAPLAIEALQAGKHVIVDKPFAMNAAEARQVIAAAKEAKKVLAVGMNQRFTPEAQKIKALVEAGTLGPVYHAKAMWLRRSGIPRMGTWFGNKALAGGGALLDIGVHLLDLAMYTLGSFDAVSVSGATYTKFGNRGLGEGTWGMSDPEGLPFDVDDFASALVKLRGGATVVLDVSWAMHAAEANRRDLQLFGENAGASIFPPQLYRYSDKPGEYITVVNPRTELKYPHCDRFANFTNALLGEEELCSTLDQALAVQRLLDAIYKSCATGREARLDEEPAAV